MRADYDSKADALDIELVRFERLEGQDSVDDTFFAAAQAALAAPDRLVELKLGALLAA